MRMKFLVALICLLFSASAGTVAVKHINNDAKSNDISLSSEAKDKTDTNSSEENKSDESVTSATEDKKSEENTTSAQTTCDQTRNETDTTTKKQTNNTTKPSKPKTTTTTTRKSTSTPNTSVSSDFASYRAEVVRLVNVERKSRGLKPLTVNSLVTKSATAKSADMVNKNYFSHTSPTYGSPFDMMKSFGISYRAAGENIAYGQRTPQEVMNGWMNSPGHKANILNSSFTQIGVGIAKNAKGQLYWTQQFIG